MNKLKLKWKIFALLLGFSALLLIILWLFQTAFLNETYKFVRRQELNNTINFVTNEINNPELQEVLNYLQEERDIIITLTPDFTPPQRNQHSQQQRDRTSSRGTSGRRSNLPYETITEVREFTLDDGQKISLTFHALLTPVSATVSALQIQMIIITSVMVFLSVVLATVIARRVSKPIEVINNSATKLAKGEYDVRFEGKGFSEIVELSDTLNTAAEELGKTEGLRRELLANVSHDLRTPLTLIYGYAEMMYDFPNEMTKDQAHTIKDEAKRLTSLINDVLDLSKTEAEMDTLNISEFNLTESIRETTERLGVLLKKEGFRIDFKYNNDVFVDADKTKIDRALYNILINAVNYSGENKDITIEQSIDDGYVKISIIDNGDGISEKDLPYVWDRYYKSGKPHQRAVTGTGLGLSIVKKIIELHGGRYGVNSEIGKGSTFWFELKIDNEHEI
jgi:signal transduction histidine kinase